MSLATETEPDKNTQLVPRAYQDEMVAIAIQQNTIVRMDTGTGKSLISVGVIRSFTSGIVKDRDPAKLIVFVVPTVALVTQQADYIASQLPLKVKAFRGDDGVEFWKTEQWEKQLEDANVIVLTAQVSTLISTRSLNADRIKRVRYSSTF